MSEQTSSTSQKPRNGKRVLLVEDNQVTALAYKKMLEREGFEVVHIAEGNNAFTAIQNQRFDLVLLDLMLPQIDGVEILKRTHAQDHNFKTPVVVLSEVNLEMVRQEVLRYGVKEFFTKTGADVQKIMQSIRTLTQQDKAADPAAMQVAHTTTETLSFDLKMAPTAPITARKISGIEYDEAAKVAQDKDARKRFLFVW